jgi:hypothetical protein
VNRSPSRWLAVGAAVATVALTVAAFWLSYEHLHDVAVDNGLRNAPARAWAWPATVDLFIIAGELLILRAALAGKVDPWAVALAATGSVGSIALNVAGVGMGAPVLTYVVAAVPPVAALLAFGALMRQVHDALSKVDNIQLAHTPSDQPFSRVRENAPTVGYGRPLTGPVRDSRSLTEGQPVPLSAVGDSASLTEVPVGPLSVGSLGDLTNERGTHSVRTPGDLRGAANRGVGTDDTLTTDEGLHSSETPEVPSAVVTQRPAPAGAPEEGVRSVHTPGDYRTGTPSGGVGLADAIEGPADPSVTNVPVDAAVDAPHPAASDAASGHPDGQPWAAEQRLPEVRSAGRMEPLIGPIPWPGLDGASVHPALHPAASAAGQTLTVSSETPADDVGPTDLTPGPDAPDALPDADASEAALIATARAVDQAARAETGRAASLRRLQAELRIGQPRAQQLQRILANA